MAEEKLQTFTYRILRYAPNVVRDEWVNIGILIHDPQAKKVKARLIDEPGEFARLRRLHRNADERLLRALQADLDAQLAAQGDDPGGFVAKLEDTLSNVLQLSPQRGLLAEDFELELDRLYREHVEAPRYRGRIAQFIEYTRGEIRKHIVEVFRRAGILGKMEKGVRVGEFTYAGDPYRIDYVYRRNGRRGFIQSLALGRDPGQAKILVYTAERIRAKLAQSEFTAVTEVEPRPEVERDQFVAGLLGEQSIEIVPLARLEDYARNLGATLR